jgi:hypothetical protein
MTTTPVSPRDVSSLPMSSSMPFTSRSLCSIGRAYPRACMCTVRRRSPCRCGSFRRGKESGTQFEPSASQAEREQFPTAQTREATLAIVPARLQVAAGNATEEGV